LKGNNGENISEKNEFYGEYTFHYWFWKNHINKIEDNSWIGFCATKDFGRATEILLKSKKKVIF